MNVDFTYLEEYENFRIGDWVSFFTFGTNPGMKISEIRRIKKDNNYPYSKYLITDIAIIDIKDVIEVRKKN